MTDERWSDISKELNDLIQNCVLVQNSIDPAQENMRYLIESAVEKQFSHALGLAPGTAHRIITITREWEGLEEGQKDFEVSELKESNRKLIFKFQDIENDSTAKSNEKCKQQLAKFKERIASCVAEENRENFNVPWKPGGIDDDDEIHEMYLMKFRKAISSRIQKLINKSLEEEPELKSKKKIVNVSL